MKLRRFAAGIALAITTAILAIAPISVFAEEPEVPVFNPDDVVITKEIKASPQANVQGDTFTFTFQALGYEDADGNLVSGTTAPAISNSTAIAGSMSGSSTQNVTTGITFPAATAFPHAGVYEYKVTESTPSSKYHPQGEEYLMRVYVENDGSGLKIAKVTMAKLSDEGEEKVDTMTFTNIYDEKADLVIEKVVTGDYGDKTKKFSFSVTVTVPANMLVNIPEVEGVRKVTASDGTVFTFNASGVATATVELKHGESITIPGLPVGTTYSITETGVAGYTPSAELYANSGKTGTPTAQAPGTAGSDYTISGDAAVVTTAGAACVVTNDYKTVTPTGILINNLPYILLIGIPMAALAVWIVSRRNQGTYSA